MQVCVYSEASAASRRQKREAGEELENHGWLRGGENISYRLSKINKDVAMEAYNDGRTIVKKYFCL